MKGKLHSNHVPFNLEVFFFFLKPALNIKHESQSSRAKGRDVFRTKSEPALFSLSVFSLWPFFWFCFWCWEDQDEAGLSTVHRVLSQNGACSHLSTSEYAAGCRLSVKLPDLWPFIESSWGAVAAVGSFLPAISECRGTRLGAAGFLDELFLGGAAVVTCFAAPPAAAAAAEPLFPEPCLALRVLLAINVSSSWEADPKRTWSPASAASANMDRAPPRLLQESQHSLL